jgi:phosphatidylglycerophosphate synthase
MSEWQKNKKRKKGDLQRRKPVGYTRIILASLSLYYMPWHPKVCVTLYCISCLLDAVDGNAARYFNQCKSNMESY